MSKVLKHALNISRYSNIYVNSYKTIPIMSNKLQQVTYTNILYFKLKQILIYKKKIIF